MSSVTVAVPRTSMYWSGSLRSYTVRLTRGSCRTFLSLRRHAWEEMTRSSPSRPTQTTDV